MCTNCATLHYIHPYCGLRHSCRGSHLLISEAFNSADHDIKKQQAGTVGSKLLPLKRWNRKYFLYSDNQVRMFSKPIGICFTILVTNDMRTRIEEIVTCIHAYLPRSNGDICGWWISDSSIKTTQRNTNQSTYVTSRQRNCANRVDLVLSERGCITPTSAYLPSVGRNRSWSGFV